MLVGLLGPEIRDPNTSMQRTQTNCFSYSSQSTVELFHQTAFSTTTMTRLSAETWPALARQADVGRRSRSCAKTDSQLWASGEGLQFQCLQLSHEGHWRARLAVQSQPTRSLGQILPSGSRPPPGPLPLPSRKGPRGGASGCASQSAAWIFQHFPPALGLPLCPPLLTHCPPTCSPHSSFKRYLCPDRRLRLLPHHARILCRELVISEPLRPSWSPFPFPTRASDHIPTSTEPLTKRRRLRPRDWPGKGLSTKTARRKKG